MPGSILRNHISYFWNITFYSLNPRSYYWNLYSTIATHDSITRILIPSLGIWGSTLPILESTIKTPGINLLEDSTMKTQLVLTETKILLQDLGLYSQKCRFHYWNQTQRLTIKAEFLLVEFLTSIFGIKSKFFTWNSHFRTE